MTMVKRNRLRSARPKATFGADGAIMAAATLAAAVMNSTSTANAAKQQAAATEAAAKTEADALKLQNDNANKNQEQMIAFNKEQFERNRDLQKDTQMYLQLLAGEQNNIDLKEAAKTQLKKGGSIRKKLRNTPTSFLRGRNGNLPFTVIDGGDVLPIGTTPEGYDLYEIIGNDHEHYHKAQGGKNKTGVGIKFADGIIEGEGNQNKNYGEIMMVTPNDAKFITVHNLKDKVTGTSINPGKAVYNGADPIEMFKLQEIIKQRNGISDDGKSDTSTPVRRIRPYGGMTALNVSPDLSLDFMAPVATGIVAGTRQDNIAKYGRSLKKCGGRRKAKWGDLTPTQKGNLWGAGWNAAGNIGGALITTLGNNAASKYLTGAYSDAADVLTNAYSQMHGVDMSLLNRDSFKAAHAMAALQAPIVNDGAQRAAAERTLQRNLARINRGTLSSAAAQNRNARAEIDYNDTLSKISENSGRIKQGIIQGNMDRLTQVSQQNAQLDTQANQAYGNAYLDLLKYNADTDNYKFEKIGETKANALTQNAQTIAGTRQANAASWAGALTSGLGGIGNTLATNAKIRNELEMTMLGASTENQYNYYLNNPYAPGFEAFANRFKNVGGNYEGWYDNLMKARRI